MKTHHTNFNMLTLKGNMLTLKGKGNIPLESKDTPPHTFVFSSLLVSLLDMCFDAGLLAMFPSSPAEWPPMLLDFFLPWESHSDAMWFTYHDQFYGIFLNVMCV